MKWIILVLIVILLLVAIMTRKTRDKKQRCVACNQPIKKGEGKCSVCRFENTPTDVLKGGGTHGYA